MALSECEARHCQKLAAAFVERHRPPAQLRAELDLSYTLQGQSLVILELRARWDDPSQRIERPVAKATFTKKTSRWRVYWQRADLKWHRYEPEPDVLSLEEFFKLLEHDPHHCFFG